MQKHIMAVLRVRGNNVQAINMGQTVHVQTDEYDIEMEQNGRLNALCGQL